jgi:phosphoglucomutase
MLKILTVPTQPISGQKPGTSGLRKRTDVFMQPHYLENYVAAIFASLKGYEGRALVIGGDGRYYNERAIQTLIKMALAAGFSHLIIGQNGLLSTPAASHLIRLRQAFGGLILSASHNPGGPSGDFGLKYNTETGGPAPEKITDAIYEQSLRLQEYRLADMAEIDLSRLGRFEYAGKRIEIVDPVADYARLMQQQFDFERIRTALKAGLKLRFDALHAVTGPYGREIFERQLGAEAGSVVNAVPLPDFGGGHPDPNPTYAGEVIAAVNLCQEPIFGAASDGDGDRNMIIGRDFIVSPSDSLAILAANAKLVPAFAGGVAGVARSMPTSRALDRVALQQAIPLYETPTGWKYFGNLLDAGKVTLCGEESAGTGGAHVREKDGLWAILFWLNILAVRGCSVAEIVKAHWHSYGRDIYSRHDYEEIETSAAQAVMGGLRRRLETLPGQKSEGLVVDKADDFAYHDPIDGSYTAQQGVRLYFTSGERAVLRTSGTGTQGATLRIYYERYSNRPEDYERPAQTSLAPLVSAVRSLANIPELTGRSAPTVIS